MAEARIIPIKGDPVEKSADAPARRRRSPNGTPRRSAPRPPADESLFDGGVAAEPEPAAEKTQNPDVDAKKPARRRRPANSVDAKPAAQPPAGSDAVELPADTDADQAPADTDAVQPPEDAVQPPDEPRDLDSSAAGGPDEARVWPLAEGPQPEAAASEAAAPEPDVPVDEWERKVAGALAFMRRRLTGEYEIDEFGFDPELTSTVLAAPLRPIYEKWFRVEVSGMENVPDTGGALIVANHSGVIALDGVITTLSLLDHHPARRHLRMLGADLVFNTPFLGEFARKAGNTLACNADAERLLSSGELVGVYPEGFKGVGKPFSERYKLQRFGRGGFVSAALRTKAPIIPCSIVGAEEIYPMLGNAKILARLLGLPYFPLTPTFPWLGPLGMIPLPSKWYIEFGEPIETESMADRADDPMLVFNVADQVRETIQQTLYRLLMKRKSVFG
jgi:1-acyl-sn-glycerol-3-phosphate acyltransferase